MGMWRWLNRRKRADRDFLVSHVLARHAGWFPMHNRGREAPAGAWSEWERRLQPLSEKELILLLTDNCARNRVLGKTWPPLMAKSEKKEVNMTEAQVKEIEKKVNELMDIGRSEGYLSLTAGGKFNEKKRNIRAIAIGEKLNEIGGMDAMRLAGTAIRQFLGDTKARELEYCWDGIGSWHG